MLSRHAIVGLVLFVTMSAVLSADRASSASLNGQWNGVWWNVSNEYSTGILRIHFTESAGSGTAIVYAPRLNIFDEAYPMTVSSGTVTIGDPSAAGFQGTLDGSTISGDFFRNSTPEATWWLTSEVDGVGTPGVAPGPDCTGLPSMLCLGTSSSCSDIIAFEPDEGWGYLDFPTGGETEADEFYSYARRDVVQLIKYATAKVDCKTAGWGYGSAAPLALADMSEEDGSAPGTSSGTPRHPPGTHEDGLDIDTAYYQVYSPDNYVRPPGIHHSGTADAYHLTQEPYALDPWRTALFVAYLSEHPGLRVIGVDGQIGLLLDSALDELVALGWISQAVRSAVPLAYEVTDEGRGWYLFHHQFMHISMSHTVTAAPIAIDAASPVRSLECHPNPFNPQTTISFELSIDQIVSLSIYDMAGRLVSTLLSGRHCVAGPHEISWSGQDTLGRMVASGTYLARISAGGSSRALKLVLLK